MGRNIGTSLCKYQDKQDYWPIIHDKLEDLFTTIIHSFQDIFHPDKCAYRYKLSSYIQYAISMKVLGQTHMWNTQNTQSNFLKIFQVFMGFWIFEHTQKQNMKRKTTKKRAKQKLWKRSMINTEANDINQSKHVKMHKQMSLNIGRIKAWTC